MRWTILMSTGDCFQATYEADVEQAGATMNERRAQQQRANEQRAKESWAMDRDDFLHHFEQVRERTMRVVSAIPEDKVEWTCRPEEWTFGDLERHIAVTERYVFAECVFGGRSRYKGSGRELGEG